jgi:AcrR family transcriptional regulator
VSPAAARTTNHEIVTAARALLEVDGPDAVTMLAVAERVGIRAPSLYKRFEGRAALLGAVADDIASELAAYLRPAVQRDDAAAAVRELAVRFRAFAVRWPGAFRLLFGSADAAPTPAVNALAAAGLLSITERLAGQEHALDAARLLVAFATGFVGMELAGAFRLGGDIDEAYAYGIEAIVAGLHSQAPGGGAS